MYPPVLVTPPTIKPITLTEAKAQLDVGYADKDTMIEGLIAAATVNLDGPNGILNRCLCEQTWRVSFDDFCSTLRIPVRPIISVTGIIYTDEAEQSQTVGSGNYTLREDECGHYIEFGSSYTFPALSSALPSVAVTVLAGYADIAGTPKTSSVPADIKAAMLMLVRHWFDNPSAVIVGTNAGDSPKSVEWLLGPKRGMHV